MVLSDKTILEMVDSGKLVINPMHGSQVQPASVDFRLGSSFSTVSSPHRNVISFEDKIEYETINSNRYLLLPGQFVLATTMEYFELPDDITAFVEGRSSLGRLGLFIQNAGWVDPGFKGEITLELYNANRCAIELEAGKRIGQLVYMRMDRPAEKPYRGKYQYQSGATGSRIYLDKDF